MKENKKIEVFSNLTKFVSIVALDEKIIPGSLVFDSINSFPAYYHETPVNARPIYIYLVLDKQYPLEEIIRASQNIEKEYDWSFDAGKGYLHIGSELLNVIRIRHIPDLEIVDNIQEAYIKQGIGFLMNKKIKGTLEAEVKVVKFMNLEQWGEGIYIDLNKPEFGYIEIAKFLDYKSFQRITMDVKYNWMGSEFDAATGSFYYDGKLVEFIRILSSKNDAVYLEAIRKLYHEKIR